MSDYLFRALWPITDESLTFATLVREATGDLGWLAAQAHCTLTGAGRWSIHEASTVPGSGRVTDTVLMYTAPATPRASCPRVPPGPAVLPGRGRNEVDEAVVLRLLDGEQIPSTRAEKEEAARRWAEDLGRPVKQLEDLHGWNPGRYYVRSRHGTQAVAS